MLEWLTTRVPFDVVKHLASQRRPDLGPTDVRRQQDVLKNLSGSVETVSCLGKTHIPERVDENGEPYKPTADDAAYATFELEDHVVAQVAASWATRVNRDDLLEIQVDGTEGSAVAGLRECHGQGLATTPKPIWNPDQPKDQEFSEVWVEVPDN